MYSVRFLEVDFECPDLIFSNSVSENLILKVSVFVSFFSFVTVSFSRLEMTFIYISSSDCPRLRSKGSQIPLWVQRYIWPIAVLNMLSQRLVFKKVLSMNNLKESEKVF